MILEEDNVELYFSNKPTLNGIYPKAETGKIIGILGSNGSGKSCLLEIIFGNINPKYKLIRIDKKPYLKPLYQTKVIKYLPQYNFLPKLKLKIIFRLFEVDWNEFILSFDAFKKYKDEKLMDCLEVSDVLWKPFWF
jgi:ABC-type multidrug transport system ATPase subunit